MLTAILGKGRLRAQQDGDNQAEDSSGKSDRHESSSTSSSEEETPMELIQEECLESWVDWKRRVTHEALDALKKVGLADWVEEQRRRLWRWSGHVARRVDGRWSTRLLHWTPEGTRAQAHPLTRWSDVLIGFQHALPDADDSWIDWAQCRGAWALLEDDFVTFSL